MIIYHYSGAGIDTKACTTFDSWDSESDRKLCKNRAIVSRQFITSVVSVFVLKFRSKNVDTNRNTKQMDERDK